MAKRKFNLGGREVTVEDVEFEVEREGWNSYILHDGTVLKVKTVLAQVMRIEGEHAPNGDPMYIVNASPVISTTVPDNLKKSG